MKKIKAAIIDDERAARNEIRRLLENYPDFEICGEAGNADAAVSLIGLHHPDVLFLDIQMPGQSGFDLLESLDQVPYVIFTTAYDQYAVKAFEVNAMDYLLKPIREERFAKAMEHLRSKAGFPVKEEQIFVKDRQQYHFISWRSVYLIESTDNYARLSFDDKTVLLKSSLNQLEKKLDASRFFRINRAQIINLQYIDKINTAQNGRIKITLTTGATVEVSDRQSTRFRNLGRG